MPSLYTHAEWSQLDWPYGDRLAPEQYYTASIQPSIGSIVYLFMHSQDIPGLIAGG